MATTTLPASAAASLRLVPPCTALPVCHETVEVLEQLLQAARAGYIGGLVFGAAMRRQRYMVNACGDLARDPTLARGVVAALDDALREKVQDQVDEDEGSPGFP